MNLGGVIATGVLGMVGIACMIWSIWRVSREDPGGRGVFGGGMWKFRLDITGSWPLTVFAGGAVMLVISAILFVTKLGGSAVAGASGSSLTPGPSQSTPAADAPKVTFDYPPIGTHVSQHAGFKARGRIIGTLGARYTVWLVDHASGGYAADMQAIITHRGAQWRATDRPLGSPSDRLPFKLTVIAVLADHQCTLTLTRMDSSTSSDWTTQLPRGCIPTQKTVVEVTRR